MAAVVKFCHKCKTERLVEDFYKDKSRIDGLDSQCGYCRKEYRLLHKNESKLYYDANREDILKQKKEDRDTNKEKFRARKHEFYLKNKERILQKDKKYRLENPEVRRHYDRKNRKKLDDYNREYVRKRLKSDINFKFSLTLRNRLRIAIKGNQKRGSAVQDLGCSIDELKVYLSIFFYPNPETSEEMTWSNYGQFGWHIDHIRPLSSFNLENREDFLRACNFTNLQPLWRKDNIDKGAKLPELCDLNV